MDGAQPDSATREVPQTTHGMFTDKLDLLHKRVVILFQSPDKRLHVKAKKSGQN